MNKKNVAIVAGIGATLFLIVLIMLLFNTTKIKNLEDTLTLNEKENEHLKEEIDNLEEKLFEEERLSLSFKLQRDSLQSLIEDNFDIEVEDSSGKKQSKNKSTNPKGGTVKFKSQKFDTYVVNAKKSNLFFELTDNTGTPIKTIGNLKNVYKRKGEKILFATNGGIFKPDYNPEGLYIEGGEELFPLNLEDGYGNFYLKPNGIFYINKWNGVGVIESSEYKKIADKVAFATQSGPLLLLEGEAHPAFNKGSKNKKLRSGVGIIDRNTAVFIISHEPVNFYDFAMLFKEEFNCKSALYLDGVISEMYLPGLKRFDTQGKFSVLIGVTEK